MTRPTRNRPASLFTATAADLPLFSGTCQRAEAQQYTPREQPQQVSMFNRREYIRKPPAKKITHITVEEWRKQHADSLVLGQDGHYYEPETNTEARQQDSDTDDAPKPVTIFDIERLAGYQYSATSRENEYSRPAYKDDKYNRWDFAIECGRSYLVGDSQTTAQFIKTHRSPLSDWQKLAYQWCKANPTLMLDIRSHRLEYVARWRGEYFEIGLPHQDHGGEKYWISKDGKSKILINVD